MARQPIDWTKSFNEVPNKTTRTNSDYPTSLKDLLADRIYKPVLGKDGNATKIIRILPPALNENIACSTVTYHEIKDPSNSNNFANVTCNNFSHNFGDMNTCDVCKKYYKAKKDNDAYVLSSLKLTTKFIYNILVISDLEVPENEGKVFLFYASALIHKKIKNFTKPADPRKESQDITDYATGRDIEWVLSKKRIPIKDANGADTGKSFFSNNDDMSEFLDKSPISLKGKKLTQKELDELDTKIYSLEAILAPENIPTKEQIKNVFRRIYGEDELSTPKATNESARVAPPRNTPVDTSNIPELPEEEDNFEELFKNK